jgi:hypothetical protein
VSRADNLQGLVAMSDTHTTLVFTKNQHYCLNMAISDINCSKSGYFGAFFSQKPLDSFGLQVVKICKGKKKTLSLHPFVSYTY